MTKEGCIINPATGRAVKTTTPLGKKLMAQAQQLDDEYNAGAKLKAAAKRAITKKPEPPKPKAAPKPKKEAAAPEPKADGKPGKKTYEVIVYEVRGIEDNGNLMLSTRAAEKFDDWDEAADEFNGEWRYAKELAQYGRRMRYDFIIKEKGKKPIVFKRLYNFDINTLK